MQKELRIGITMRVTEASGYNEKRDSLAMDWSKYMLAVFPEAQWLYIPNIQKNVANYINKWKLNTFIITGGEDMGKYPERDNTEYEIYKYAVSNELPLLGICRGLQVIYTWMGGEVIAQPLNFSDVHLAKNHFISFQNELYDVNSYHYNKLDENTLPTELKVIARGQEDDSIEAVQGNKILGLMWHPEREATIKQWDAFLIKQFFLQ